MSGRARDPGSRSGRLPTTSVALGFAFGAILGALPPANGYQLLDPPHFVWPTDFGPVPYWVANRGDDRMGVEEVVAETRAAFSTWEAPPEIGFAASYHGLTSLRPFDFFDHTNTLGFTTPEHLLELGFTETTLAVTSWLVDVETGAIAESDILVNPAFHWTDTPESGGWDYRSLMVHEIGHFLGLGHSNVGRYSEDELLPGSSVMWPFSFGAGSSVGRVLTADDIAGASLLYPGSQARTGRIAGTVTSGGAGVSHAHVIAFAPVRGHTVGAWADEDGRYEIGGLVAGLYVLRANPLPESHAASRYFFDADAVDADFRVTVIPRLVTVQDGGVTEVQIEVHR